MPTETTLPASTNADYSMGCPTTRTFTAETIGLPEPGQYLTAQTSKYLDDGVFVLWPVAGGFNFVGRDPGPFRYNPHVWTAEEARKELVHWAEKFGLSWHRCTANNPFWGYAQFDAWRQRIIDPKSERKGPFRDGSSDCQWRPDGQ